MGLGIECAINTLKICGECKRIIHFEGLKGGGFGFPVPAE